MTGFDWPWPLGGDTAVPVANSESQLADVLKSWRGGAVLPGREDLLDGLGADNGDATARLLAMISNGATGAAAARITRSTG